MKKKAKVVGLVIWKAKDGWRWRWVHENGRIGAESGEAYTRKADAQRGWKDFVADVRMYTS